MGNGALVGVGTGEAFELEDVATVPLGALEHLSGEGFFMKHPREYARAVEGFVRAERLDALEVVVPAGRIKAIAPLHLAAKYGSLDCVELFVSAGFNSLLVDDEGKTPLHWCATNRSAQSALCATFFALSAPASLAIRDRDGNMPLHLACKRNNDKVFSALLTHGAGVRAPDASGKTVGQIAKIRQLTSIQNVLQEDRLTKDPAMGATSGRRREARERRPREAKGEVDMERIMAVWNRFFENAFRSISADIDTGMSMSMGVDGNGDVPGGNGGGAGGFLVDEEGFRSAMRGAQSSAPSAYVALQKEGFFDTDIDVNDINESVHRRVHHVTDKRVSAWLEWLLCYSVEHKDYYVVHRETAQSEWLSVHLERQAKRNDLYCHGDGNDSSGCDFHDRLPCSPVELVQRGWMPFYDHLLNDTYWMQLSTGQCERCLPIGSSSRADAAALSTLGLRNYEGGGEWFCADNCAVGRWVVVLLPDDDDVERGRFPRGNGATRGGHVQNATSAQGYYFQNTLTGHISWTEPDRWIELIEAENDGWALCRHEDDISLYWWHMASGEVSWAENW